MTDVMPFQVQISPRVLGERWVGSVDCHFVDGLSRVVFRQDTMLLPEEDSWSSTIFGTANRLDSIPRIHTMICRQQHTADTRHALVARPEDERATPGRWWDENPGALFVGVSGKFEQYAPGIQWFAPQADTKQLGIPYLTWSFRQDAWELRHVGINGVAASAAWDDRDVLAGFAHRVLLADAESEIIARSLTDAEEVARASKEWRAIAATRTARADFAGKAMVRQVVRKEISAAVKAVLSDVEMFKSAPVTRQYHELTGREPGSNGGWMVYEQYTPLLAAVSVQVGAAPDAKSHVDVDALGRALIAHVQGVQVWLDRERSTLWLTMDGEALKANAPAVWLAEPQALERLI